MLTFKALKYRLTSIFYVEITNWKAKITMAFMQYVVVTKREKNLKTKVHEITNARNPLNIVALTYYLLLKDGILS